MRIALTEEQEQLRSQLRAYFAELVTPEIRAGLSTATGDQLDEQSDEQSFEGRGCENLNFIGFVFGEKHARADKRMRACTDE